MNHFFVSPVKLHIHFIFMYFLYVSYSATAVLSSLPTSKKNHYLNFSTGKQLAIRTFSTRCNVQFSTHFVKEYKNTGIVTVWQTKLVTKLCTLPFQGWQWLHFVFGWVVSSWKVWEHLFDLKNEPIQICRKRSVTWHLSHSCEFDILRKVITFPVTIDLDSNLTTMLINS